MRVITGKYRSMYILPPKSNNSRPTDNKVKEAVFDLLYPLNYEFYALDLFSCTGQMGLEFLSRGGKFVAFNEINRRNYKILKENLGKIREDNFLTLNMDFRSALKKLKDLAYKFDYIYLDPPYKEDYLDIGIGLILSFDLLKDDGKIITESDRELDFSETYPIDIHKKKKYGRKIITIYKKR